MDWGDAATWAGVAAAIGIAIASWLGSRRSAKQAAESAERSAAAAEATAEGIRRQADLAEAQATKYAPPWELRWRLGDTYSLVNTGDDTEYDVQIEIPDGIRVGKPPEPVDIDARSSATFWAFRLGGEPDETITVTWHHHPGRSDERRTWRHPLPPKPQ